MTEKKLKDRQREKQRVNKMVDVIIRRLLAWLMISVTVHDTLNSVTFALYV